MGLSSTVWFVIAVIALLIGAALLLADSRRGSGAKDRKRWAALRGWEFLDTDPVLPSRWRYGTIHQGGPGVARNLVAGQVPTPDGPRQGYLFDQVALIQPRVICTLGNFSTKLLRADLASGAWDRKYGHLRSQEWYKGSLRLIIRR